MTELQTYELRDFIRENLRLELKTLYFANCKEYRIKLTICGETIDEIYFDVEDK